MTISPTYERFKEKVPNTDTKYFGPLIQLSERIWTVAEKSGWHKETDTFYEYLSALGSEVGEAHNAYRDHNMHRMVISNVIGYDHVTGEPIIETPGKPEGIGPELADIIIRTCHLARFLGIDLDYEVNAKMQYIELREERKRDFDN